MKSNAIARPYMLATALVALSALTPIAQSAPETPSLDQLASYLTGHWQCDGHFANGKSISSVETFKPILDGKWLLEIHQDNPPHRYSAYSIWGPDAEHGKFSVVIHDNSGGLRNFYATNINSVTTRLESADAGSIREAFMFIRQAPDKLRITYERGVDGKALQLGDTLLCTRAPELAEPDTAGSSR